MTTRTICLRTQEQRKCNSLRPFLAEEVNRMQFNSKPLYKDGDPVSLQLIFPGAILTCKQIQHVCIHIYKTTHVHRTNTGKHRQTQLTLSYKTYPYTLILNFYNVYTNMYIHHNLSFMNKKEQYIVNNKHIEQTCNAFPTTRLY